jgi:hypothetical protein
LAQIFRKNNKDKKARKWRSQNKDFYKIFHFYSTMPTGLKNEDHTIRICTKFYIFIQPRLYVRLENEGHTIRICTKYYTFIPPFLYARLKNEGSQNKDLYKALHLYYILLLCKARKWRSQNKDLYKELHLYSIMPLSKVKKRGSQNKDLYKALLSLGGTIRNVTPQIFETYPISKQHKIHIKKTFHSKLFIKRLHISCRIQNSN